MKQIWEDDFNNLYRDVEDMQNHCAYLESENKQLQSNWNSLREWLIEQKDNFFTMINVQVLLDKMNELEGGQNE